MGAIGTLEGPVSGDPCACSIVEFANLTSFIRCQDFVMQVPLGSGNVMYPLRRIFRGSRNIL